MRAYVVTVKAGKTQDVPLVRGGRFFGIERYLTRVNNAPVTVTGTMLTADVWQDNELLYQAMPLDVGDVYEVPHRRIVLTNPTGLDITVIFRAGDYNMRRGRHIAALGDQIVTQRRTTEPTILRAAAQIGAGTTALVTLANNPYGVVLDRLYGHAVAAGAVRGQAYILYGYDDGAGHVTSLVGDFHLISGTADSVTDSYDGKIYLPPNVTVDLVAIGADSVMQGHFTKLPAVPGNEGFAS